MKTKKLLFVLFFFFIALCDVANAQRPRPGKPIRRIPKPIIETKTPKIKPTPVVPPSTGGIPDIKRGPSISSQLEKLKQKRIKLPELPQKYPPYNPTTNHMNNEMNERYQFVRGRIDRIEINKNIQLIRKKIGDVNLTIEYLADWLGFEKHSDNYNQLLTLYFKCICSLKNAMFSSVEVNTNIPLSQQELENLEKEWNIFSSNAVEFSDFVKQHSKGKTNETYNPKKDNREWGKEFNDGIGVNLGGGVEEGLEDGAEDGTIIFLFFTTISLLGSDEDNDDD